MGTFIELLKNAGIILGAASSLIKSYKEVIKPWLIKRRKNKMKLKPVKRKKP